MKKNFLIICFLPFFLFAQIPAGYYNAAEGKSISQLKTALYNIIKNPNVTTYAQIWYSFLSTDERPDNPNHVWDMYSDIPDGTPPYIYTMQSDQCGNYSKENDCYNREHSFPKSWFDDALPMLHDLFHIYPTDGYVNGKRSNYPFGEVQSASWTSRNGSKLGDGTSSQGYTGTVFEPIDAYKGDFARTYFYMATCYENVFTSWFSNSEAQPMLAGNAYPGYKTWAVNLLLKWHRNDPVSQKETNRNDAVYSIQGNRNPFIDYPELVEYIWGNKTSEIWNQTTDMENVKTVFRVIVNNNKISILTDAVDLTYTIYNITGQMLKNGNLSEEKEILLNNLDIGSYIIKLKNSNLQFVDKFFISANQ
jgi:endonuclease I